MNVGLWLVIGMAFGLVAGAGGVWITFCLPKRTSIAQLSKSSGCCQKDKEAHNCTSCQGHST